MEKDYETVIGREQRSVLDSLEERVHPYMYSVHTDPYEIVRLIDQYLLDNSEWRMVTLAVTWAEVEDVTVTDITYEVIKDAVRHDIDPDTITSCIVTVINVADPSLNGNRPAIISIYYK